MSFVREGEGDREMPDIPANNGRSGGHLVAFQRDDSGCVHLHIYCQGVQAKNRPSIWRTKKEKENPSSE